ncbi:MAG: peptidoglycan DD-metalloendopeptidase family protein [Solirubrobacteraceae bacterium]
MRGTLRRTRAMLIFMTVVCGLMALAPAAMARFGDKTLRMGARGPSVRILQSSLTTLGFETPVVGRFGRQTKINLKAWERQSQIRPNGVLSRAEATTMTAQVNDAKGGGPGGPDDDEAAGYGGTGDQATSPAAGEGGEQPAPEQAAVPVQPGEAGLMFPVRGPHDFGGAGARFGADRGGRSHQGQDIFAKCGTPLKAVEGGKVVYAGYQSAAGNYIVIKGDGTKRDYVYMHLQSAAAFKTGAMVMTAAPIGLVGETGNAQGCHLHFEVWTAPGWYNGGRAVDPMPFLKQWDSAT